MAIHFKKHAINSTDDHSSTSTPGKVQKANENGLPVDATNTDEEVAHVVSAEATYGDIVTHDAADFADANHNHDLSNLNDVDITGISDGHILIWDNDNSKWAVQSPLIAAAGGLVNSAWGVLCHHPALWYRGGLLTLAKSCAYWHYIGKTQTPIIPKKLALLLWAVAAGTQVAEVGLFSTPLPPNKAAQTLTKLAADTMETLSAGSARVVRNENTLNTEIAAGTHLWVGVRSEMQTTQPSFAALAGAWDEGMVLIKTSADAFDGATATWDGVLPTTHTDATVDCPDIRIEMNE